VKSLFFGGNRGFGRNFDRLGVRFGSESEGYGEVFDLAVEGVEVVFGGEGGELSLEDREAADGGVADAGGFSLDAAESASSGVCG
jgi:hypothetical protein